MDFFALNPLLEDDNATAAFRACYVDYVSQLTTAGSAVEPPPTLGVIRGFNSSGWRLSHHELNRDSSSRLGWRHRRNRLKP